MHMDRKRSNIRFISNEQRNNDLTDDDYQPNRKLYKFYQICMFKNPNTYKYSVRTIYFNGNQDLIECVDNEYTTRQCNSLISSLKTHEYKTYSTYDLDLIDFPNSDDFLKVQSDLLY